MKFSLIICTYKRSQVLLQLLQSVKLQTVYPDEILIVDGSTDDDTEKMLENNDFDKLIYFNVDEHNRGLTRQRNFGIKNVDIASQVICFLDDDTILEKNYFEELVKTFQSDSAIVGVGGVAINENRWESIEKGKVYNSNKYYLFEDYKYKEALRNKVRNYLKLQSNLGPGMMPEFSHGRTCGFPLNGKTYEVDLLIGMSMAFRKKVFDKIKFSVYFDGYGLYEDADFCIRALSFGKNVINTAIQLSHFHHPSGRPNQYVYGKMVVRNGWYVWRVKYPSPSLKAKMKWHSITILLILIRATNIVTNKQKKEAFTETLGRIVGWFSIFVKKPQ